MTDPYREPAEVSPEPSAVPSPPEPFPGPWKWKNGLWRSFFDTALGGCVSGRNDAPLISYAPRTPFEHMVDRAESVADEAYRRAFYAEADPEFDGSGPAAVRPLDGFGPWFLVRDRFVPEGPFNRRVVRENLTTGDFEIGWFENDGPRLGGRQDGFSSAYVKHGYVPIRPVLVDDLPEGFVWTQKDCEDAAADARMRGAYGTAASHACRAAVLREIPLPSW